jgi:hypothetical protein
MKVTQVKTTQQPYSVAVENSPAQAVWEHLGSGAERYIPQQRLEFMFAMTQSNVHDTFVMALGYIIKTLEFMHHNGAVSAAEYESEVAHYKQLLNNVLRERA